MQTNEIESKKIIKSFNTNKPLNLHMSCRIKIIFGTYNVTPEHPGIQSENNNFIVLTELSSK